MTATKHFVLIGITTLFVTACTSAPAGTSLDSSPAASSVSIVSHGGPVQDLVSLIDHLRGNGLTVILGKSISQPFFSVQGRQTMVGTETIQMYEYADAKAMATDTSKVSPDGGSVGTSMMSWVGPPHFFKKGRILVLYVGNDQKTVDVLASAMGPQFAGR